VSEEQPDYLKKIHYVLRNVELLLGGVLLALIVIAVHFWPLAI